MGVDEVYNMYIYTIPGDYTTLYSIMFRGYPMLIKCFSS